MLPVGAMGTSADIVTDEVLKQSRHRLLAQSHDNLFP